MYVSNSDPGTGQDGFDTEPDRLDHQAARITSLGDELRDQVDRSDVQPLMLGTSPPAQWFAAKLAAVAGPDGTPRALREWTDSLAKLGTDQRAAATSYRNTDGHHTGTFDSVQP